MPRSRTYGLAEPSRHRPFSLDGSNLRSVHPGGRRVVHLQPGRAKVLPISRRPRCRNGDLSEPGRRHAPNGHCQCEWNAGHLSERELTRHKPGGRTAVPHRRVESHVRIQRMHHRFDTVSNFAHHRRIAIRVDRCNVLGCRPQRLKARKTTATGTVNVSFAFDIAQSSSWSGARSCRIAPRDKGTGPDGTAGSTVRGRVGERGSRRR